MRTLKKLLSLFLALAMVVAMTACTTPAPDDEKKPADVGQETTAPEQNSGTEATEVSKDGGMIKIGLTQDFKNPLWLNTRDQNDFIYTNCYIETLMVFNEKGAPTPFLAKSVTGDADEKTYTIVLNEGIKFHDGSLFNAEVCAWNLQMYHEQGLLSTSFLKQFYRAEVVDEYTVKVYLG